MTFRSGIDSTEFIGTEGSGADRSARKPAQSTVDVSFRPADATLRRRGEAVVDDAEAARLMARPVRKPRDVGSAHELVVSGDTDR